MERRFDMSDFERSLKDHADHFKMIPSKRVWNGIYNNLHPGSKWPSITVALVFLITLFSIGTLNNNSGIRKLSLKYKSTGTAFTNSKVPNEDQKIKPVSAEQLHNDLNRNSGSFILNTNNNIHKSLSSTPALNNILFKKGNSSIFKHANLASNSILDLITSENNYQLLTGKNQVNKLASQKIIVNKQINHISILDRASIREPIFISVVFQPDVFKNKIEIPASYLISSTSPAFTIDFERLNAENNKLGFSDNSEITKKPINTKRKKKKMHNNLEWTFYATPTLSSVSFNKKTMQSPSGGVLPNQRSFKLKYNKKFGLELGTELSVKLNKKIQFITGFNLNYSGYNNVSNLVHPTFTTLTLNDNQGHAYLKNYFTHYGNGQTKDNITLPNYNIEAAIPVGLQYNIWGNKKLRIDIASLLEPSIVIKGNAYMISSDGQFCVNDPSLIRRTNLEAHIGSYITLIGKKIKWHLGPDFRYQLFSTYKNIYPTKEHLFDYGIRIGISK